MAGIIPVFSIFMFQFLSIMPFTAAIQSNISKPGCPEKCGEVLIPYPFGLSPNCSLGEDFEISCDMINGTYMPFLGNIGVLNISLSSGQLRVNSTVSSFCYNSTTKVMDTEDWFFELDETPYRFNREKNKFTVIGCNTLAFLDFPSGSKSDSNSVGCFTGCNSLNSLANGPCTGIGCCQTAIPNAYYNSLHFSENYSNSLIYNFSRCGYAFLMEYAEFKFNTRYITTDELYRANMSLIFDWTIGNQTCHEARNDNSYVCIGDNSTCVDSSSDEQGYLCNCSAGYQGNPYLAGGCQDIDECAADKTICKEKNCYNMLGSYRCVCPPGTHNISYSGGGSGCEPDQKLTLWVKLVIGIMIGLVVVLLCILVIYMTNQQRKLDGMKKKYFQQYGGRMLLEEMKSRHGQTFTLFSEEELKEATNGYNENTMLGKGGNGTVYKGTLKNNDVVAIKRSCQTIDERQKKEFGKEMLILSQINHKNIVRILGCCLEVEIPILVYEFMPNGTLFDLIHVKRDMRISLSTRLRIALEAADSLAYLHSKANPPIVHRDVKSSNILLDENFMAKVSDFGASILVPMNQDLFFTVVQGTRGYLDPEYVQSGQLTVKSDVYSFGVVLLELIMRRKPLYFDGPEEERCLSSRFLSAMKANKLDEILDAEIVNEDNLELINEVAKIAKTCLLMEGEKRPEMRQVAEELDKLRKKIKHPSGGEHLEEKESLFSRGESSKNHEIEMLSGYHSLENKAMLQYGR